jgi:tetratricopeptide (TPR) repeat protein
MLSRSTRICALILALAGSSLAAQRPAPLQRGGNPKPETPQLVVNVLASSDPKVGLDAANAIQRRLESEHSATELYIVPRTKIDTALKISGFNPDSTLGAPDLMMLTRQMRGDYALTGTIERTAAGVQTFIRLLTQSGQQLVSEPLAPVVGSDLGDLAKKVDRAVSDAVHAVAFSHDCRKAALMGDYKQAMVAARQGLQLKPTSVVVKLCVLSVLNATHAPSDSIVAVAATIAAADSTNMVAWATLAAAYEQRGDSARALDAMLAMHRVDPSDEKVTEAIVDRRVVKGQSDTALAMLDSALRLAPDNAQLLRKRWLLDLHLGRFARALASGAAFVAADSTAATEDYFRRQLGAAKGANDSIAAHRIALNAAERFPTTVDFLLILARDAIDAKSPVDGLALANRALAIDPASRAAWQLAIAAHVQNGAVDSAVAVSRRALAAGVPSDAIGTSLLSVVTPALDVAQKSRTRADWEKVLSQAAAVDSVASSARSQFYIGFAAFQMAQGDMQGLADYAKVRTPTRAQRQTACASATQVEDLVRIVSIAMPKGGSIEPATASQILGAVPGYSEFVMSVKQASCQRE